MKRLVIGLLLFGLFGLTYQIHAQGLLVDEHLKTEELAEINILALNATYLNKVLDKNAALPVQQLERSAAEYDVTVSNIYSEEFDTYEVNFENSHGRITASYDADGEIMRSYEKFKDVKVPKEVAKSIAKKFPGWHLAKTTYLVNYHQNKDVVRAYKVYIEKGREHLMIKTDERGNIL